MHTDMYIVFIIIAVLVLITKAVKRSFRRKRREQERLPAGEYIDADDNRITVAAAGYLTWIRRTGHVTTFVSYDFSYKEGTLFLSRPDEALVYSLELTEGGFVLDGKTYKRRERVKPDGDE